MRIYLDYASTTPVRPEVFDAMEPFLRGRKGNPSSIHFFGQLAKEALAHARRQVAGLIGAQEEEILFTSGGSEANNLALQGGISSSGFSGSKKILLISAIEHHSVDETAKALENRGECRVVQAPVDGFGTVDSDWFGEFFQSQGPPAMVSVMHANNEVGTIEPIERLAGVCREHGTLFHTDAVQSCALLPFDVDRMGVDLASLSAHKMYGPMGVGALFIRKGVKVAPILFGGGQERGRRAGTENLPGIVGFGMAAELAKKDREELAGRLTFLRDRLIDALLNVEGSRLNGPRETRSPNNVHVSFEGLEGESLAVRLDLEGISVGTGSACQSGSVSPSHVLTAMGRSEAAASEGLRLTLGRDTTEDEIDRAAGAAAVAVRDIRRRREGRADRPAGES